MFMQRAFTAIVALAVFASALFLLPQNAWAALLLAMLALGAWEWSALAQYGRGGRIGYTVLAVASAVALRFAGPLTPDGAGAWDDALFALSCAFWFLVAPFWLAQRWTTRNKLALGAAGWVALVPMWTALVHLKVAPWTLLLVISIVWIADTAAYLSGKRFGRRKLAPLISPGKTWEGALGAAAAVAVYYGAIILLVHPGARDLHAWTGLAVFLLIFVLSIEGDLFESWMKRQAGLKDSGHLLPGHGGILDRIDGLTATMPLAALALDLLNP
jgi:phosphatidate cytidylyltransferase